MYGETCLDDTQIRGGSDEMISLTENAEDTENTIRIEIFWFVPDCQEQTRSLSHQSSLWALRET
jgi:hypothetical protein